MNALQGYPHVFQFKSSQAYLALFFLLIFRLFKRIPSAFTKSFQMLFKCKFAFVHADDYREFKIHFLYYSWRAQSTFAFCVLLNQTVLKLGIDWLDCNLDEVSIVEQLLSLSKGRISAKTTQNHSELFKKFLQAS